MPFLLLVPLLATIGSALPRPLKRRVRAASGITLALFASMIFACQDASTQLADPASPAASRLANTRWDVVALNGNDVPSDAGIHLEFAGATVTGNSGCNSFGGEFVQEGNALRIGPVAGTRMGCAPPASTRQEALYAALPEITKLALDGERLQLLDAAGAVRVALTRVGR